MSGKNNGDNRSVGPAIATRDCGVATYTCRVGTTGTACTMSISNRLKTMLTDLTFGARQGDTICSPQRKGRYARSRGTKHADQCRGEEAALAGATRETCGYRKYALSCLRHSLATLLILSVVATGVVGQERDAKQLIGRPSASNYLGPVAGPNFGGPRRTPINRGRGKAQLTRLENGPLTLQNGKLRPVSSIDRTDTIIGIDQLSQPSNTNFRLNQNLNLPKPTSQQINSNQHRNPHINQPPTSYFPQDNVPFSYNSKPVPQIYLTGLPGNQGAVETVSEDFEQFEKPRIKVKKVVESNDDQDVGETIQRPFKPETVYDWSTKVSQSTDGKQIINLDTKYFSLAYPDKEKATTADPGLMYVTGRPGLVLRKVKGRMKTSTSDPGPVDEINTVSEKHPDLCDGEILECGDNLSPPNATSRGADDIAPALPSYKELLKHFKKEVWVIPVLIAAGIIILVLTIFEIFLLAKAINKNPSRRHLFLGQMLLAGLLACSGMAVVYTLKPTPITCAVIRLGSGLSYSLVYSTLLVKLVFLISLNSGVYLPATYQSLLLCFAILIQLVIGIQWLVSAPPDVADSVISQDEAIFSCTTLFRQQLLGLLYVVFLISVVVLLAFKSRGVRENYREAMYVGLTMGFTVAIWIVWIVAGLIVPTRYQDVCSACGLIACTSITFVIMFMPKGRQLSAMGKEGVYAEDRTDVYTGSGTGSTGSSGTPSPSFFPVKPGKLIHHYRESRDRDAKEREYKERPVERERLDTPPSSHKHLQIFGPPSARTSNRDVFHENLKRDMFHDNLHRSSQRMRSESPRHGSQLYGRGRSTSPRASHLYGHPLFRSSHGDLVRASSRHKELPRFASHRDLTRSDPVRSSRRRQTEGSRSREILATISPRRLPSCHRCLPPGLLASGEPRWNKEFHNPAFHY